MWGRGGSLIGLDHIPVAVRDLDRAVATYRALGFAIKPGRPHANGIRNAHVKFGDGPGIELITADEAVDDLTARYRSLLADGDGPAFLALRAPDTDGLRAALRRGTYAFRRDNDLTVLRQPALDYLFFVHDNRSPTDRPEHFAHSNGARALIRVWIATDDRQDLERLLVALGASVRTDTVRAPEPGPATVASVENGEMIIVPAAHQLIKGRPIIGATFRVGDVAAVVRQLSAAGLSAREDEAAAGQRRVVIPPHEAHGMWLAFEGYDAGPACEGANMIDRHDAAPNPLIDRLRQPNGPVQASAGADRGGRYLRAAADGRRPAWQPDSRRRGHDSPMQRTWHGTACPSREARAGPASARACPQTRILWADASASGSF